MKPKRDFLKKKIDVTEEIPSDTDEDSLPSEDAEEDIIETAHEKHIRLTREAVSKAKQQLGSDEEEFHTLSSRLTEEALLEKGRLLINLAQKVQFSNETETVCLNGHKRAVTCVCISSDCNFAFSGGKDSNVIKWDLEAFQKSVIIRGGKRGSSYPFHTGPVLSITISSDDKYLVSSGMDESVIVWNPQSMEVLMKLTRHRAAVTVSCPFLVLISLKAVSFRRQSHMLFSADTSGRVCVWSLPLSDPILDQGARTNIEILGLYGLTAERCIACTGFGNPGITVWKVPEEICVQHSTKNPLETAIECVCAVNDDVFIGGSATNTLYLWHASRCSPVFSIHSAHPEPKLLKSTDEDASQFRRPVANWVSAIAVLAGTDLVASASSTGHIQLWRFIRPGADRNEMSGGRLNAANVPMDQRIQVRLERLPGCTMALTGFVTSLAFSKNRKFLLVGLGQEHRLGKWEPRRPVEAMLCMLPLKLPTKFVHRGY